MHEEAMGTSSDDDGIAARVVKRRRATPRQRLMIAHSQQWKCKSCGNLLTPDFDIDHREPLAGGGLNDMSNLQALCPNCHAKKSRMQHQLLRLDQRARRKRMRVCMECGAWYSKYFPNHQCYHLPCYHPKRMGPTHFPPESVIRVPEPWKPPEGRLLDRLKKKMEEAKREGK